MAREVSDAGRDIAISALTGLSSGTDRTGDVFIDERLDVIYTLRGRRSEITIGLFGRKQDFEPPNTDEKRRGLNMALRRDVSRKVTLTLLGSATRTEFVDIRRVDDDTSFGASLSYRLGRSLSFSIEGEWNKRDSDDPSQDYDEKRVTLQIAYN